jgi:hypothetical protein
MKDEDFRALDFSSVLDERRVCVCVFFLSALTPKKLRTDAQHGYNMHIIFMTVWRSRRGLLNRVFQQVPLSSDFLSLGGF